MTTDINPVLKAMLQASTADSPLSEADPQSVDILLERINQHMIAGTPEKIDDQTRAELIKIYRAQAQRWATEERLTKTKKSRTAEPRQSQAIDL